MLLGAGEETKKQKPLLVPSRADSMHCHGVPIFHFLVLQNIWENKTPAINTITSLSSLSQALTSPAKTLHPTFDCNPLLLTCLWGQHSAFVIPGSALGTRAFSGPFHLHFLKSDPVLEKLLPEGCSLYLQMQEYWIRSWSLKPASVAASQGGYHL